MTPEQHARLRQIVTEYDRCWQRADLFERLAAGGPAAGRHQMESSIGYVLLDAREFDPTGLWPALLADHAAKLRRHAAGL